MTKRKLINVVIIWLVVLQTLVFSALSVFSFQLSSNRLYQAMNDEVSHIGTRLEHNLPPLLWNFNDQSIEITLKNEIASPYISAIAIKVDGQIQYSMLNPDYPPQNNHLDDIFSHALSTPLFYQGNDGQGDMGQLLLKTTDAAINANLQTLITYLIVQSLILNFVIISGSVIIIRRYVIKPLNDTNHALKGIVTGGDVFKNLPQNNILEINELATNYNQVSDFVLLMLKKSQWQTQHLKQIFDHALDGIIIFNTHGEISSTNPAFYRLFQFNIEETISISALFRAEDCKKILAEIKNYETQHLFNYIGKHVELDTFTASEEPLYTGVAFAAINENNFIAVIRDISGQKTLQKNIEQALAREQELGRLKSEFLASMSHEIRTPMNGVIGMLELIQKTELTSQQSQFTEVAHASAFSLLDIINDILDFSKIEAGKLELEQTHFNIQQLIAESAHSLVVKIQEKALDFYVDTSAIEQPQVLGDPVRIRQILINLISNSIKFTAQGHISVIVTTQTIEQTVELSITVKDSGIGIAKEKQATLFDSFSQVDSSTTRKYGGTGLGLTIVKQLTELMKGTVEVQSNGISGTTFMVNLILPTATHPDTQANLPMNTPLHALIVLNDANVQRLLANTLSSMGIHSVFAEHHDQVFEVLAHHNQINLAFIEMGLTPINGARIGYLMTEQYPHIKKIMVNTYTQQAPEKMLEQAGFALQMQQPLCQHDLSTQINTLFSSPDSSTDTLANKGQPLPHKQQILLVEDNAINQLVALNNLEALGYDVVCADNGKIALDILNHHTQKFHAILMDCQMPEMDGYQATKAIRAQQANAKFQYQHSIIIAMTANAMRGDKEKCLTAGMDDYLSKPIDTEILAKMLNKWIET